MILRELSETLPPTCQFDGFDISDVQYPPKSKLPANISLHVGDIKQPVPPELHGQFDVVNIRYLNAGMKQEDWAVVTRNVCDMLKLGGWFQWIEGDFSQVRFWYQSDPVKRPSGGAPQELGELLANALDPYGYHTSNLAPMFRAAGLKNVTHEVASTDRVPETRSQWAQTFMGPVASFAKMQTKMNGWTPGYCEKLLEQVMEEAKAGVVYARIDIHTFLGQKA